MSTWMDISGAPKDGRKIRVIYDNDESSYEDGVYWQAEGRCCILGARAGAYPPGWTSSAIGLPVEPTKWMPIPEQPESVNV